MSIVKLNNKAVSNATAFGSISSLGSMVFLSSATASSSASIEFSLGDYKEYQFYYYDIIPSIINAKFKFNLSTDNGSNYNVVKTTTYFVAYHGEAGDGGVLTYYTGQDLAQGTGDQSLNEGVGNSAPACCVGNFKLFNPSSTTFVKHFMNVGNEKRGNPYCEVDYMSGYANTTSALTNIKFNMDSGTFSGKILLFGVN